VARAAAAGVDRIVTIGVGRAGSERAVAAAEEHAGVWATVGVHPHDAAGWAEADAAWLAELGAHPRVVGVGECGLDFFRNHATPVEQQRAFSAQIGIARDLDKPLVVHTRDAADETIAMLDAEASGVTILLHCFSLVDRVAEVVERGWFTSFAGQITFSKADEVRFAAAALPADRLLVETDSPYLTPVPNRGKPNQPANVVDTLARLAEVRGITADACEALTDANAQRLFGW
jgi:TatD DNase family protein